MLSSWFSNYLSHYYRHTISASAKTSFKTKTHFSLLMYTTDIFKMTDCGQWQMFNNLWKISLFSDFVERFGTKAVISVAVKRFRVSSGRSGLVKLDRLFPRAAIHGHTLAPFIMSECISFAAYIKLLNSQISGVMGKSGKNRAGFGQIRKLFISKMIG